MRARFAETYSRKDYRRPLRQFEGYELVTRHWELNPHVCGYIDAKYDVTYFGTEGELDVAMAALDRLGIENYSRRPVEVDSRTKVVRVHEDTVVAWRLLTALSAPQGAEVRELFGLPAYLGPAPGAICQRCVGVYLLNWGSYKADEEWLYVREERPKYYVQSLGTLFRSLTDSDMSQCGQHLIALSPSAPDDFAIAKKSVTVAT
jgi:hypothetical protein